MNRFIAALSFLTIIPLPKRYTNNADFNDIEKFFPIIGVIIGFVTAISCYIIYMLFPPLVAAILSVAILLKITGGLHIDGLSDTADGFLSHRDREKTLVIMKDSCIGSMGSLAQIFLILLKVAAVYELSNLSYQALFLAPIVGRCSILLISNTSSHAKNNGLGHAINSSKNSHLLITSIVIPIFIAILIFNWKGVVAVGLALATAIILSKISERKIGGFTGDVLGAGCEISEMITLIILSGLLY